MGEKEPLSQQERDIINNQLLMIEVVEQLDGLTPERALEVLKMAETVILRASRIICKEAGLLELSQHYASLLD